MRFRPQFQPFIATVIPRPRRGQHIEGEFCGEDGRAQLNAAAMGCAGEFAGGNSTFSTGSAYFSRICLKHPIFFRVARARGIPFRISRAFGVGMGA